MGNPQVTMAFNTISRPNELEDLGKDFENGARACSKCLHSLHTAFVQGIVAETQGWQLKRLRTFAKNRLANRPNRPRDPMLRSFMAIGIDWPEPDTPEQAEWVKARRHVLLRFMQRYSYTNDLDREIPSLGVYTI